MPGARSRNPARAEPSTASIHIGAAVTRNLPARPASAAWSFSSAASISSRALARFHEHRLMLSAAFAAAARGAGRTEAAPASA